MTLTLSKSTIEWLLESQQKLDDNIKQVKGISDEEWMNELNDNHFIALKVEASEFVNETIEIWKYWKSKPSNLDRILDEAIDVIHFIMLISNKIGEDIEVIHRTLTKHLEVIEEESKEGGAVSPISLLKFILNTDDLLMMLASMLHILDGYHFTEQDIIDQYKVKNKENFRRLETGY